MSRITDQKAKAFIASLSPKQRTRLLRDAARLVESERKSSERAQYQTPDGIVRFVREVIGADPAPYQERILKALVTYKRVAVRGPHGLGKTALAAWVVLWGMFAFDDDVKIPTTASAWRQLQKFLWPEIRKWARRLKWDGERPRILDLAIKMTGKEAFAVASDNPDLIEGAHAKTIVYVFDEAKAIPNDTWDAAEGAFSGAGEDTDAEAYALAISTPGEPSGRFYDIHARRPGLQDWHVIHVTVEEAIAAGRISRQWVDLRKEQWGEQSAVYQNRVAGEFDESGEDSIIPLSWVEKAHERWLACNGSGEGDLAYGVDPARYGVDKTAIARRRGRVIERVDYYAQEDTMKTAGRVAATLRPHVSCGVDVIGLGAGVLDRLRELGFKQVQAINVSESAVLPNGKPITDKSGELTFFNLRTALWWLLREELDPSNPDAIALPPDDDRLTGDLIAPRYSYTSKGQLRLESKDDIRARIGRSTDGGDAVVIASFVIRPRAKMSSGIRQMGYSGLYRARDKRPNKFWQQP